MTTAWGTGALLSPSPTLDKGRGKDRVGGDGKAAATEGASEDERNSENDKPSDKIVQLQNSNIVTNKCMFDLAMADIPESFVGAGDKGGAESFMGVESEHSIAISFGTSQSDFLFREPMAGFI